MAGSYDSVTDRYVTVTGANVYPVTGWSISAMFYPDSSLPVNTFAYLIGQGTPQGGSDAINLLLNSAGTARVIVDDGPFTPVDLVSSNLIDVDQWNHVAVSCEPNTGQSRLWLNGVLATDSVSPWSSITPSIGARIGYATHGGSRQFNGRIAHPAKWSRVFTSDEGERYTNAFVSPEFAQQDADWHIELYRGGIQLFDLVGNANVTETSMVYGPHAPADYPMDAEESDLAGIIEAAAAGGQFTFA